MVRIDDFKDDIVAGFELADDGIELILVRGGLAIDAGYYEARLETLQVCEGAGAHRANHHAGSVNLARHGGGHVVHHNAELGFACAAGGFGIRFRLRVVHVGKDLVAVADAHGGVVRFAVAQEAEANRRTGLAAGDLIHQILAVLDGAAVDGGDDVAWLQSALVGRAAGLHLLNEYAALEAVDAVDRAGKPFAELDADGAACDLVAGADEIVVDVNDGVRRHGETDALVAGRLRVDGRVHADHFAVHVQQRAAGVAGIDGSIRLDKVLELPGRTLVDGAVLGRDDAGRNRLRKGEGAADGFHPVAHLRHVRVAELY